MVIEEKPWRLSSECTTKATEPDGTRHDCDSRHPDIFECPDGWVLDDKNYEEETEKNGSDNRVYLIFEKYIRPFPNVPQIEFPTKVSLSVHARSPGGYSSGRGWTKTTIKGRMFSYKQLVDNVKDSLSTSIKC